MKKSSASLLVSEVQKVDSITPLVFYYAGKEKYEGERFFWKHPSEDSYIIGLGICKQISTDQVADRFFHVEREWKRFIDQAIIYNNNQVTGVGPIAFGGFSFDPLKEKTMLWSKFSSSLFHIPKFMLTVQNDQFYLTTNIICTNQDDLSLYDKIEQERQEILHNLNKKMIFHPISLEEMLEVKPEEWKNSVTQCSTTVKK